MNLYHNRLQDGLHLLVKLLLFYIGINTNQNVLLSTKPFLQFWPGVLKSYDPGVEGEMFDVRHML